MSRVVSLGGVGGFDVSGERTSALSLAEDPGRRCTTLDVLQHQEVFDKRLLRLVSGYSGTEFALRFSSDGLICVCGLSRVFRRLLWIWGVASSKSQAKRIFADSCSGLPLVQRTLCAHYNMQTICASAMEGMITRLG